MNTGFKNVPLPNFPGNWPEDYEHENGKYQNRCTDCQNLFFGHKRRPLCKICANKPIDWESMAKKQAPTQHESWAWQGCWADGEMTGYARCMVKKVKPLEQANAELLVALERVSEECNSPDYHFGISAATDKLIQSLISKHKAQ